MQGCGISVMAHYFHFGGVSIFRAGCHFLVGEDVCFNGGVTLVGLGVYFKGGVTFL